MFASTFLCEGNLALHQKNLWTSGHSISCVVVTALTEFFCAIPEPAFRWASEMGFGWSSGHRTELQQKLEAKTANKMSPCCSRTCMDLGFRAEARALANHSELKKQPLLHKFTMLFLSSHIAVTASPLFSALQIAALPPKLPTYTHSPSIPCPSIHSHPCPLPTFNICAISFRSLLPLSSLSYIHPPFLYAYCSDRTDLPWLNSSMARQNFLRARPTKSPSMVRTSSLHTAEY